MADEQLIDDGTDWGYWLHDSENGWVFIVLPKLPMQKAGLTEPPFHVTRPDGKLLYIVSRRKGAGR